MKKKSKREINCIKVNLNTKIKYENPKKLNNITYVKIKENYDSYHKRNNQNQKISKDSSTINRLTIKNEFELKNSHYNVNNINISLIPYAHRKKINNKKIEEMKKMQRNIISSRRLEYSKKVKNAVNIKKIKQFKYDINKVIVIQKWVKGYLLRCFLSNASEVEKIINEFVCHIHKYIFFKFSIFKKLRAYIFTNNKNISDNFIETKKYFSFINDNISISNINTNNNTDTFTNNNTFSVGQETPEVFENRNRGLLIYQKRIYKAPSIRDLLMKNTDFDKTKKINRTINPSNQNDKNEINMIRFQKAKSSNNIKKNENMYKINSNNNLYCKSIQTFSSANLKIKEKDEMSHNKNGKTTNLRTLLFSNIDNNTNINNNVEKIYKKPLLKSLYITKEIYLNKIKIINTSPKSEKLFLPKIYQISLYEDNLINIDNNIKEKDYNKKERNENPAFGFEKILIDEIKEVKEDEEDDSQSQLMKKINTSFYENFSESQISEINNKKNKDYNIASSSFQINPCIYDKKKILIVLLLKKQINFSLKPYVFNTLKNYYKNKIFS